MSLATEILAKVDQLDAKAFAGYFAADGRIVFGNGDALVGPDTVEAGTAGFFDTISGLSHRIDNEWTQ
ncbi:MAG: nuclear transport factor 2 family protein, partial [Nakamurella sp.]